MFDLTRFLFFAISFGVGSRDCRLASINSSVVGELNEFVGEEGANASVNIVQQELNVLCGFYLFHLLDLGRSVNFVWCLILNRLVFPIRRKFS